MHEDHYLTHDAQVAHYLMQETYYPTNYITYFTVQTVYSALSAVPFFLLAEWLKHQGYPLYFLVFLFLFGCFPNKILPSH